MTDDEKRRTGRPDEVMTDDGKRRTLEEDVEICRRFGIDQRAAHRAHEAADPATEEAQAMQKRLGRMGVTVSLERCKALVLEGHARKEEKP